MSTVQERLRAALELGWTIHEVPPHDEPVAATSTVNANTGVWDLTDMSLPGPDLAAVWADVRHFQNILLGTTFSSDGSAEDGRVKDEFNVASAARPDRRQALASYDRAILNSLRGETPPTQSLVTAYELGKGLSSLQATIWRTQRAYASRSADNTKSNARSERLKDLRGVSAAGRTARRARYAWRSVFDLDKLALLHWYLSDLRSLAGVDATSTTGAILDAWLGRAHDPRDKHWPGKLKWRGFWTWQNPGDFTPRRALQLATRLRGELLYCRDRLADGLAGTHTVDPSTSLQPLPVDAWPPAYGAFAADPIPGDERPRPRDLRDKILGAFLAAMPLAPIAAGVISVALYKYPVAISNVPPALPTGLIYLTSAWIIVAVLIGLLGFITADRASMGTYGELLAQLAQLQAWSRVARFARPTATYQAWTTWTASANELDLQLREIDATRHGGGPRWVLGAGYITLWQRLHRAQEALLEIVPTSVAVEYAKYDILRFRNSTIENSAMYVGL
ncbi:MAG: hypothetical protein JO057_11130, partial [Chloroflexi bacterium]|nr:hypothetical protein [Chloroflexota bacterium]